MQETLLTELPIFPYESDLFGYGDRLQKWTDNQANEFHYTKTTKEGRARAGFVPHKQDDRHMLKCQFCDVEIKEPDIDEYLMGSHINVSPDCIYVQSEINYIPDKIPFSTVTARKASFQSNQRFATIRSRFQAWI